MWTSRKQFKKCAPCPFKVCTFFSHTKKKGLNSTPQITKKERKSALQTTNGKKRERRKRRRTVLLLRLLRMSLWTLLQSVLLVANAFAVLNEERFLEPKSLSQSAITSGYVSAHGFKGQLIGLIYAASYLRMPLLAANAIVIFVKVLFG